MGVCDEWGGPRAVERSEAGGVDDNERHLRHSPVSSPTEELRKDKKEERRQWKTREDQAWILICVLCAAVVREGLPLYFCVFVDLLIKVF